MDTLIPLAGRIARMLIDRRETLAVAESSSGGLVSSALLAIPGASAYFIGGAVVYTRQSRRELLGIPDSDVKGVKSATPRYAAMVARAVQAKHATTWGLAETGAAGPSGNRYGDPAGHTCIAVCGPSNSTVTITTGNADRTANMRRFAAEALAALEAAIGAPRD